MKEFINSNLVLINSAVDDDDADDDDSDDKQLILPISFSTVLTYRTASGCYIEILLLYDINLSSRF